uniref:Uncharacterized protein n=1 Tax=Panagrolaimus sp. PS1159 TaxID=55785 RepID=A0AC35F2C9_9BILA
MEFSTESNDKDKMDHNLLNKNDTIGSNDNYNSLLDELGSKTEEFMKVICTTKTVKTAAGKIQADNIIKWHETDKSNLEKLISTSVLENGINIQAIKEKIEEMKISQNEMQKKIKELEENETKLKIQIDTKQFQVDALNLSVKERDDKIQYLKQKLRENQ